MLSEDYIKIRACTLAWLGGGHVSLNGMLAILYVLRNRVNAGWGDWLAVVESHDTLAPNSSLNPSHGPDPREPGFNKLLAHVDWIYDGRGDDRLTDGALYYADMESLFYDKSGWFHTHITAQPELHPRTAQVGTLTFFK